MFRFRCFLTALCLAAGAALGCGGRAAPVDPAQARVALDAALEAWKQGATPDSLLQRSPPIHFRDDDWTKGWTLKSFKNSRPDEPHGLQLNCFVQLSLKNAKGEAAVREVQYLIDTSPALVIVRVQD